MTDGRTEDGGKWKIEQCSVGPETAIFLQRAAQGTHGYPEAITGDNSKWGVCHSDELYYFWRYFLHEGNFFDLAFFI